MHPIIVILFAALLLSLLGGCQVNVVTAPHASFYVDGSDHQVHGSIVEAPTEVCYGPAGE